MTAQPGLKFPAGLRWSAVLAFLFVYCPVIVLAQEKPDPLIQPSPAPSPQQTQQQPSIARDEPVLVNTDLISFNVTKLGRYEICSQLGAGGMGEMYVALDTE